MSNNIKTTLIILVAFCLIGGFLFFFSVASKTKNAPPETSNNIQKDQLQNEKTQKNTDTGSMDEIDQAITASTSEMSASDHATGSIQTALSLVFYGDFDCPFSANFSKTMDQAMADYGNRLKVIFRHFPSFSHINAVPAAIASECASQQGKFWPMYRKLYEDYDMGELNYDEYKKDAKDLGLNVVDFMKCYETEEPKDKIEKQMIEARNSGVSGTPTIIIDDEIIPGDIPFDDFTHSNGQPGEGLKSIIERHLK
jgi:protein-disulfide isomerase